MKNSVLQPSDLMATDINDTNEKENCLGGCLFFLLYLGVIIIVGYLMFKYFSSSIFEDWVPDYP